jgi:hypothetical protein
MLSDVAELRTVLARAPAVAAVSRVFAMLQNVDRAHEQGLTSPQRQLQYILGLMLTTPEPSSPRDLPDDKWQLALDLSERIFGAYGLMYWPSVKELAAARTDEWRIPRQVVMPIFLHFLGRGSSTTCEQLIHRIECTTTHFDQELHDRIGITATNLLTVIKWIGEEVQRGFDDCSEFLRAVERLRDRHIAENWDNARARREARLDPVLMAAHRKNQNRYLLQIDRNDIAKIVGGSEAIAFWKLLVSARSPQLEFTYPAL